MFNALNDYGIHMMDAFEFESGRVLENVEVEYSTYGTPKYDDEGFITNAILFFSTFNGEFSFVGGSHQYIIKHSDFDSNEFFFIVISSLGSANSCSPSTTNLKYDFPKYTYIDAVNFERQFLSEKFKIRKILGLIGEGVGGFEVLTWACEYPDEMEFIFVVNSSFRFTGYKYILAKAFESIIDSSDEYYSDNYSVALSKLLVSITSLIFAHSSSKMSFDNLSNYEIDALMEDFIDEGLFMDIYDFKYRNDCNMEYNVEDKISNIKAKSLFVGTNDNYFDSTFDFEPYMSLIENSQYVKQEKVKEDFYFHEEDYDVIGSRVLDFLEHFKK